MSTNDDPLILVVDDEEDVADAYALRIQGEFRTRTAYGGEAALDRIDEEVEVVLLDRRMPDIHGDDVLAEIRDQGYDCAVIMVTAVDPDLNILEMDFDDYLSKPITRDTLIDTLDQHLETTEKKDELLDEFLQLVSKLDILEDELTHGELLESEEYQTTKSRAEELGGILRDQVDNFDEVVSTYRDIDRS